MLNHLSVWGGESINMVMNYFTAINFFLFKK